ncbi:hypothetical protein CCACVL1_03990 [Corchorus capsularis]|uniref:Uncharacterized protein n=1 Tax=Corchorus capsularis TaxID=210143 RepID=A0A1R3JVT2_COCAP|nr:hypothetical protein CCACVL1_03990 [Corchorus capsularis]
MEERISKKTNTRRNETKREEEKTLLLFLPAAVNSAQITNQVLLNGFIEF